MSTFSDFSSNISKALLSCLDLVTSFSFQLGKALTYHNLSTFCRSSAKEDVETNMQLALFLTVCRKVGTGKGLGRLCEAIELQVFLQAIKSPQLVARSLYLLRHHIEKHRHDKTGVYDSE